MARLENWRPRFSIIMSPDKRRQKIRELWDFLYDSEQGDELDIGDEYQFIGAVYDYGDYTGKDFKEGDEVLTSEVKSICHTRHKDPVGLDFTVFTQNTAYDVTLEGVQNEFAEEARMLARVRN